MGKILFKGRRGHRGSVNQTSSQRCTSSRATDATATCRRRALERSGNMEGSMSMPPTSPGGSGRLAAPPAGATSGGWSAGEDRKSAEKGDGVDVGYARMRGELMLLPSSSTLLDGVGDIGSCEAAELRSFANGEAPQLVLHARGEDPITGAPPPMNRARCSAAARPARLPLCSPLIERSRLASPAATPRSRAGGGAVASHVAARLVLSGRRRYPRRGTAAREDQPESQSLSGGESRRTSVSRCRAFSGRCPRRRPPRLHSRRQPLLGSKRTLSIIGVATE